MKFWPWIVVLLLAASCAAPEPPEAWAVQRVTPTDDRPEVTGICEDIRVLALGAHADDTTLDNTLAELARIAAVTGATDALPILNELGTDEPDETMTDAQRRIRRHDMLVTASRSIDNSTTANCGIPAFSALYAASGFPDCHFEMEIPVAGYTTVGEPGTCSAEGRPDFLPCFSDDGDHLPVDCVTGEIVQTAGTRWDPAGEPRVVEIDRVDPDAPAGPEVIVPSAAPECAGIAVLFETEAPSTSNIDRLGEAVATLDSEIRDLVDDFVAATFDPPSLDEFERILATLDAATVDACGFPLVSAWATITAPVDDLPCWTPTSSGSPAYKVIDCVDQDDA